ncbi:uncharacterized protein IWZ02DRAFT_452613 [Phyllosticta citriasiana]|uniref:uncharacterized protein n=1 Tax=Phyllosticta citriasiana TaxID=595635 RepID=UPI0030FDDEBF
MKHFWHERKARRAVSKIVIQGRTSRVEADAASASITIARCGVLNMSEGIRKWWYYKDRRKRSGAVKGRRPLDREKRVDGSEGGDSRFTSSHPSGFRPATASSQRRRRNLKKKKKKKKVHPRPRSVRGRWRAIAGGRVVGIRSSPPLLWRRGLGRARRVVGTTAHVGRDGGGFPSNHGGDGEREGGARVGNIAGGRVVRRWPSDGIGGTAGLVRDYQNDGVVVPRRNEKVETEV